jgi:hypothetical protein
MKLMQEADACSRATKAIQETESAAFRNKSDEV